MSAWSDYGFRNGFGIGLMIDPAQKSSWYVRYYFSQAQAEGDLPVTMYAKLEYPDYRLYNKNHSNFNTLVIGWRRSLFSTSTLSGYCSLDLGYNLASESKVIAVKNQGHSWTEIVAVPVNYDHSIRCGLAFGSTVRVREYLDYYLESGINIFSKMHNINGISRPSSSLKLQTGFIVKI
ncbi:MAG: hypothetical protein WC865_06545 [Bacteroidales bacterium]